MRCTTIPSRPSYHIDRGPTQTPSLLVVLYPYSHSKSHHMIAPEDFSLMRLEHAAANAGPAAASGFSDDQWLSPRQCPREQHNVHPDYHRESSVAQVAPLLVVKPFTPIPVGPWSGGNCVTIPPMPYPVQQPHEVRFKGPFLHGVYRTLAHGGRIVAFVLGVLFLLTLYWLALTTSFDDGKAAVYRTCIIVAFFRLPSAWHATHRRPSQVPSVTSAEPFTSAQEYDEFYHGLDEVNLLEELSAAQRRASQALFALSPFPVPRSVPRYISKTSASPSPAVDLWSTAPTPATRATLRKSSRRTPFDVPCFHLVGSPISEEDALLGVPSSLGEELRRPVTITGSRSQAFCHTETTPVEGRGWNGRASVLGATVSFTLERAPPHPAAVTSSRLDRQRSAAETLSPFPTITTPLILSSIPDNLRADFSHPNFLSPSPFTFCEHVGHILESEMFPTFAINHTFNKHFFVNTLKLLGSVDAGRRYIGLNRVPTSFYWCPFQRTPSVHPCATAVCGMIQFCLTKLELTFALTLSEIRTHFLTHWGRPSLASFAFIKFFHPRDASLLHDGSTNLKPHYPPVGIAFQPGENNSRRGPREISQCHGEQCRREKAAHSPAPVHEVTTTLAPRKCNPSYDNKAELYHHLGPLLIRGRLDNNPKWADPAIASRGREPWFLRPSLTDSNHTSLPNRNKV
ncbi:hypothetical protein EDB85DRAFT_2280112 [Lactarius pseudohatsudake]|nr:hypothetical protein EDB85DRAFT_2280112 [Lactarius pseudohatsudake]